MVDPASAESALSGLHSGIQIFTAISSFGRKLFVKARHRYRESDFIQNVSDKYFRGEIHKETSVTVEGFLSKFGYLRHPLAFRPTVPGKTHRTERIVGMPQSGKITKQANISIPVTLLQFPLQRVPEFKSGAEPFSVAFLYPSGFRGFIFDPDPDKARADSSETQLLVTPEHRSIPVLLARSPYLKFTESHVRITAVVDSVPDEFSIQMNTHLTSTLRELNYSFLRPYSDREAFCLDGRSQLDFDITQTKKEERLPGCFYLECHLDRDLSVDEVSALSENIPGFQKVSFNNSTVASAITCYATNNNVRVLRCGANLFSFYIETDILDSARYEQDLKEIQSVYHGFRKKGAGAIRQVSGNEVTFRPDFVSDFSKQRLFHSEGVLASETVQRIIDNHPELLGTVNWLRDY